MSAGGLVSFCTAARSQVPISDESVRATTTPPTHIRSLAGYPTRPLGIWDQTWADVEGKLGDPVELAALLGDLGGAFSAQWEVLPQTLGSVPVHDLGAPAEDPWPSLTEVTVSTLVIGHNLDHVTGVMPPPVLWAPLRPGAAASSAPDAVARLPHLGIPVLRLRPGVRRIDPYRAAFAVRRLVDANAPQGPPTRETLLDSSATLNSWGQGEYRPPRVAVRAVNDEEVRFDLEFHAYAFRNFGEGSLLVEGRPPEGEWSLELSFGQVMLNQTVPASGRIDLTAVGGPKLGSCATEDKTSSITSIELGAKFVLHGLREDPFCEGAVVEGTLYGCVDRSDPPFFCGEWLCKGKQYCAKTEPAAPGDEGDATATYTCVDLPRSCLHRSCRCLQQAGIECTQCELRDGLTCITAAP